MANDEVVLVSGTDTPEEVAAALAGPPVPVEEPPAPAAPVTPDVTVRAPDPATAAADEPAALEEAEAGKPKKGSLQQRINELVSARHASQREAEAAKLEIMRLTGEKQALEARLAAPPAPATSLAPTPQPDGGVASSPTAEEPAPTQGDFDTYEEFVQATARWNAQREAKLEVAAVRAELTKTFEARWAAEHEAVQRQQYEQQQFAAIAAEQQRLDAARQKYPDWDEKMLAADAAEITVPPAIIDILKRAPVGPEVAYYLASHPDDAKRIAELPWTLPMRDVIGGSLAAPQILAHLATEPAECIRLSQLHPIQALIEVGALRGRIEARTVAPVVAPAASQTPPPAVPSATRVPLPAASRSPLPPPVTALGGSAVASSTVDPEDMDYQQHKAWMNRKERQRAGLMG